MGDNLAGSQKPRIFERECETGPVESVATRHSPKSSRASSGLHVPLRQCGFFRVQEPVVKNDAAGKPAGRHQAAGEKSQHTGGEPVGWRFIARFSKAFEDSLAVRFQPVCEVIAVRLDQNVGRNETDSTAGRIPSPLCGYERPAESPISSAPSV